jgi:hypothetical protein
VRVEIVCSGHEGKDRILPRLARCLSEGTGWPVVSAPSGKADLTYFFPYLERKGRKIEGKTAAWFTHRDDGRPEKVKEWRTVAGSVDLRLTSARLYLAELERSGAAALVTPPLDRDKFRPAERVRHAKPVVGTSGYCYPGGRKGEELLQGLRDSKVGSQVSLVATGRGWPVPTKPRLWQDMEAFYQGLDLYVCTSSIEGVGYGPLEALACGVPVVVPSGVGVFDELGTEAGVYRYQANDLRSLLVALESALLRLGELDPLALRAATERFTAEAWVAGHVRAFEELVNGKAAESLTYEMLEHAFAEVDRDLASPAHRMAPAPAPVPDQAYSAPNSETPSRETVLVVDDQIPDWRGRAGVYMVAYGEPSRRCALRCIDSVRRHMPGLPVCLVSDRPLGPEDLFVEEPDSDIGARGVKTRIYDLAPSEWEYVLYLDADTELLAPVDSLFRILADGWELVICPNPDKYVLAGNMKRPDNGDELAETFRQMGSDELLQFNGGVFAFRRCGATAGFFEGWHREWTRWAKRDQAALDRQLYRSPVRVWTVGSEFNRIDRYEAPTKRTAIAHHPTEARRTKGIVAGRGDSPEAWMAVGVKR